MLLVEIGEWSRKQIRAGDAGRGKRKLSDLGVSARRERTACVREQGLRAQHIVREYLARRRQRRAAGAARDALDPELRLERCEVLRDRRLTDVRRLGGSRERAGPGDRRERPQTCVEIHHLRLYRSCIFGLCGSTRWGVPWSAGD